MKVHVRRATPGDARLLLEWRNDPVVRRNSFSEEVIPWERHRSWLDAKLRATDTKIFLLEADGKPVAQVRYEKRGTSAEIGDISVDAGRRGQGYGRAILTQTLEPACQELGVHEVVALVKNSNVTSAKMFVFSGFRLDAEVVGRGVVCTRFVYRTRGAAGMESSRCDA